MFPRLLTQLMDKIELNKEDNLKAGIHHSEQRKTNRTVG